VVWEACTSIFYDYSDPGSDSSDEDLAVSTRDLSRRDVTLKREEEDESQAEIEKMKRGFNKL
jgi:hypothetical protein